VWIALLVLTGILLGGVFSFARNRQWWGAVILLAAAALSAAGAYAWLPR
jgi:MFS-type transporter involved in bile tolerance (Atg22 family)